MNQEIVLRLAGEEEARAVKSSAVPNKHCETVLASRGGEIVACVQLHVATTFRHLKRLCGVHCTDDYVSALVLLPVYGSGEAIEAIRYVLTDYVACGPFVSAIFELSDWNATPRWLYEKMKSKIDHKWIPVLHSSGFQNMADHLKGDLQVKWEGGLPFKDLFECPIQRDWMR